MAFRPSMRAVLSFTGPVVEVDVGIMTVARVTSDSVRLFDGVPSETVTSRHGGKSGGVTIVRRTTSLRRLTPSNYMQKQKNCVQN